MPHVFISYSRKDETYARAIADQLLARGFDVWLDDRIDYGDNWELAIFKAIDGCAAFVVIMSPNSYASMWVRRECQHAEKRHKPPFPLLLEGEEFPGYGLTQYIDVRDQSLPGEDFYQRLAQHAPRRGGRGIEVSDLPSTAPAPESRLPDAHQVLPPPFAWCEISPGGVLLHDASEYGGTTGGRVMLDKFYIARYPITNAQYQVFVEALEGYRDTRWWDFLEAAQAWRLAHPYPEFTGFPGEDVPRTHVTWYEAVAFCRWLTVRVNTDGVSAQAHIVLTTEAQWQRAALGESYGAYPWGITFDKNLCNTGENGTGKATPVSYYLSGASPFDVVDMSGNVWEWCLNDWPTGGTQIENGRVRAVRGGSWLDSAAEAQAFSRDGFNVEHRLSNLGFRIAVVLD